MTLQTILNTVHPILHTRCKWVKEISDPDVQQVINDLLDTIPDNGAGLAAPQIGSDLRIAVVRVGSAEEEKYTTLDVHGRFWVLVNPWITYKAGSRMVWEGCLSVPGCSLLIPRSCVVTVRAFDRNGIPCTVRARDNAVAQALEHEIDHLNGVMFVDHWDGDVRNMRRG
jgi:peptide deformylase